MLRIPKRPKGYLPTETTPSAAARREPQQLASSHARLQACHSFTRTRRSLQAMMVLSLFASLAVAIAAPQERSQVAAPLQREPAPNAPERERSPDLATDNLDMISASAGEIREVLSKDAGLMMELKRLMAKQATDRGQIVAEEDLDDSAILNRLDTDLHFRAMATRLLQRYGYLTPQVNPLSLEGQEQQLVLKARAEQMVREGNEPLSPSRQPNREWAVQGNNPSFCSSEGLTFAGGFHAVPSGSGNGGETVDDQQEQDEWCRPAPQGGEYPVTNPLPQYQQQVPPRSPQTLPPGPDRPDLSNSPFLTASAVSSGMGGGAYSMGQERMNSLSGSLNSSDLTGYSAMGGGHTPGVFARWDAARLPSLRGRRHPGRPAGVARCADPAVDDPATRHEKPDAHGAGHAREFAQSVCVRALSLRSLRAGGAGDGTLAAIWVGSFPPHPFEHGLTDGHSRRARLRPGTGRRINH